MNAVKLLIDGIPSNSNDGNMPFLDMVFALDIDSIEIVRGTADPRYGLNNIAGNVNLQTRMGGNDGKLRLRYGSFDTREVQLVKGVEGSNWTQNYFLAGQQSQGYRDHAEADRQSFAGKWFYTPDDQSYRAGLIVRHYQTDADEAGYLTRADAHQHPTMSNAYNATDRGTREMSQVSLHLDSQFYSNLSWSLKAYLNRFEDERWTQYWVTSSQQERLADETQYGAIATLTYRPEVSGLHDFAIESGLDTQRQDNQSLRYRTLRGARLSQTRDQDFELQTVGGYVQAIISPVESLRIIPAYRVDKVSGNYHNNLSGEQADANDYGLIKQPKFSVEYAPIEQATLYANWGRTFQIGVGSGAYRLASLSDDLVPSINEGWETGIKFHPRPWLDGRVAYWQQEASDEVRRKLNDAVGDAENVGQTRRWGYDLQVNVYLTAATSLWLAYVWQKSEILKADPNLPASQGQEIDHVPHQLYSLGADYQATPALALSAWVNGQSSYYLERTNSQGRFGDFVLLNLGANYRLSPTASVDLQLKNVADRYYEYVWFDPDGAQGSLHSPGDGRALYAGLTLDF